MQNSKGKIKNALWLLFLMSGVFAGETRPAYEGEIQAALARGETLRLQKAVVASALQSYALRTLIGGVPCGYALVALEDAKGEGGAAYRLIERFSSATADDAGATVVTYSTRFMLGPDLALLTGNMEIRFDFKNKKQSKDADVTLAALLDSADGKLNWDLSVRNKNDKAPALREKKSLDLHGVKPIPKNALLALAAFSAAGQSNGFKPDAAKALCVPALEYSLKGETFTIEPAWITFDLPALAQPRGTALQMCVRYLVGEMTEKGIEIDSPSTAVWRETQIWAFDNSFQVLSYPVPVDPRLTVELAEPGKLNTAPPFDLEKIAAATQALEENKK